MAGIVLDASNPHVGMMLPFIFTLASVPVAFGRMGLGQAAWVKRDRATPEDGWRPTPGSLPQSRFASSSNAINDGFQPTELLLTVVRPHLKTPPAFLHGSARQRELDFTVQTSRGSLILWTGYWREGPAVNRLIADWKTSQVHCRAGTGRQGKKT